MKVKQCFLAFYTGAFCLVLLACVSPPKPEMDAAEKAVKDAGSVNANKYANAEYQEAVKELETARANFDKGNKKNKLSKAAAVSAKEKGDVAYFKSNKEITVYKVDDSKKSKSVADSNYAKELASEKYAAAEKALADAEKIMAEAEADVKKLKDEEEAAKNAQTK